MSAYQIVSSFYLMKKNKEKYATEREVIKPMHTQALFLLFSYSRHNTMNFSLLTYPSIHKS